MKFLVVFALAFASVLANDFRSIEFPVVKNEGRISNGKNASPGEFYYQVGISLIKASYRRWCGGSFIGQNWILTAAHCTNRALSGMVYLGATQRLNAEKIYNVSKSDIIIHPDFNLPPKRNDISLIRIPTTSESGRIGIVRIPKNNDFNYIGGIAVISGWGSTNDNTKLSNNLQYGVLEVSPGSVCSAAYKSFSDDIHICVDTPNRVSTCQGDSGGPLVLDEQNLQIGLVSFASDRCAVGRPIVFTRVSAYLPWIRFLTGINL